VKNNLYQILDLIRARPGLYIGEKSITLLCGWIAGWGFVLGEDAYQGTHPPFADFNDWVALRLGFYESTSGWRRMLLSSDEANDEESAFDRFFMLLDEFRARQARIVLHAAVNQSRKPKDWIDTAERKVLPWPERLEIIKYTHDKGVFLRFVSKDGDAYRDEYCIDLDCAFDRAAGMVEREEWVRKA
jgi:hypothetical protein